MSIIPRASPLNLSYNVALVTHASSPLGVIVCKTLLKANALVLGIDSRQRDPSLNAGLGTHFQFFRAPDDGYSVEDVLAAASEGFGVERVDVLINVTDDDNDDDGESGNVAAVNGLVHACVKVMREQGNGGAIIHVLGQRREGDSGHGGGGVRIDAAAVRHQELVSLMNSPLESLPALAVLGVNQLTGPFAGRVDGVSKQDCRAAQRRRYSVQCHRALE